MLQIVILYKFNLLQLITVSDGLENDCMSINKIHVSRMTCETYFDFEAEAEVLELGVQILLNGEPSIRDGFVQICPEVAENLKQK